MTDDPTRITVSDFGQHTSVNTGTFGGRSLTAPAAGETRNPAVNDGVRR